MRRLAAARRASGSRGWARLLEEQGIDVRTSPCELRDGGLYFPSLGRILPGPSRSVLLTGFNSAVRSRAGGVVFDTSGDVVCARAGQTLVRLQTPEELQILEEIYLAGTYHFQLTGPLLIVDIGMNTAFTALYFAAMHPDAVICAYEPFADTFHFAEANIG